MRFLITGGAGYIGSHFVNYLHKNGYEFTIVDDLSTGNSWAVRNYSLINVNILDYSSLETNLGNKKFDAIFHFAAKSIASESFSNSDLYYDNNFIGTKNILNLMRKIDCNCIIFSSTAAVYGRGNNIPILENDKKLPINPYGESKLLAEEEIMKFVSKYKFKAAALRYFNVAGSNYREGIGEYRKHETHLIPKIMESIEQLKDFYVFGNSYKTYDGTCVRDYLHVNDVVDGHIKAYKKLMNTKHGFYEYNLGSGRGYSVLEVISACNVITGKTLKFDFKEKRRGDPDYLISNIQKAQTELNWFPKGSSIENIISSAWRWSNILKLKKGII